MINLPNKQDIVKVHSKRERDLITIKRARVKTIRTALEVTQCTKRHLSLDQIKKQSMFQESVIIYNQTTQPHLLKRQENKRVISQIIIITTKLIIIIEKKKAPG